MYLLRRCLGKETLEAMSPALWAPEPMGDGAPEGWEKCEDGGLVRKDKKPV